MLRLTRAIYPNCEMCLFWSTNNDKHNIAEIRRAKMLIQTVLVSRLEFNDMLSRRDKLLIQPWEDRRFKDHRSKVRSALPAIDDRAPASRPHVVVKLKKFQRELDRKCKIQDDNYSLLQRLNAIMKVNRLDNHWPKPLPNFQQKVGLFYDAVSLNSRITLRSLQDDTTESSYSNVKCYACEVKKRRYDFKALAPKPHEDSLPSIF